MARIASTVADLIGGTPLVRINHVVGDGVDVVAKVESFNPASSVKDLYLIPISEPTRQADISYAALRLKQKNNT